MLLVQMLVEMALRHSRQAALLGRGCVGHASSFEGIGLVPSQAFRSI